MNSGTHVHWREGMFLRPQHFQAFSTELIARITRGDAVGRPGASGVIRLELDAGTLARDVFSILEAEILFADGTLARIPGDATAEPREFAEFFVEDSLPVYLGIASATPGSPLIQNGPDSRARYQVEVREVADENLGEGHRELEFRRLLARFFFGDEDRAGYECLQIARLVRRGRPVAESALCESYVPPALACGAAPVVARMLDESVELLRSRARDLAASVPNLKSLTFAEKGADISSLVMLQAVNSALASLELVAGMPLLDPHAAYRAMVTAIGHLAIFGDERIMPVLPRYDLEGLTECFGAARDWLAKLAEAQPAAPYDCLPFVANPSRSGVFELGLDDEWLAVAVNYYLGVEIGSEAREVMDLVANGVKLVAPTDVEKVIKMVVHGIDLDHVRRPPISFPSRPDLHYFKIQTEGASREGWLNIVKERKAVVLSTLSALGKEAAYHMYVELPK